MKTQTQKILKHMRKGWINPLQALRLYGCFRLAARINEIKEHHMVVDMWISARNADGKLVRVKAYTLR